MKSSCWWSSDSSALVKIEELSHAVKLLEDYQPANEFQSAEKNKILSFCQEHPDALYRSCLLGHLTASAVVTDPARERFLLHHHAKLDLWLQFGGHCDGDGNLPHVAWREAVEESGISDLAIDPEIVDLDVHKIPKWKDVPEHLHLDVRFLAEVPAASVPVAGDESLAIGWYSLTDVANINTDDSVQRLVRLAANCGGQGEL